MKIIKSASYKKLASPYYDSKNIDRDIDYPPDEPTWQDVDGRW